MRSVTGCIRGTGRIDTLATLAFVLIDGKTALTVINSVRYVGAILVGPQYQWEAQLRVALMIWVFRNGRVCVRQPIIGWLVLRLLAESVPVERVPILAPEALLLVGQVLVQHALSYRQK